MNNESYTYLLSNPQKLSEADVSSLNSVIEKYPFFQSARALQLKALKNQNSFLYNDALKLAAAHTTNRDILFEYITSESFVQNEISSTILQHDARWNEMEVISEDITAEVSLELDKQMKVELKKAEAILNPKLFERKLEAIKSLVEEETGIEEIKTVKGSNIEEEIALDSPLEFTQDDTHSFGEWLKLTSATPIDRTSEKTTGNEPSEDQEKKNKKFALIEKFIQDRPKLKASQNISENKNLAEPYTKDSNSLMTETLAKVYLQQKNFKKAIQAYKILILKYPEKSGFFADQIRAIEKLINTEE